MPPKKVVAKANASPTKTTEKPLTEAAKTAIDASEKPKPVRKALSHPPAMAMVKEALKELDQRKGVSAQAIRNFIKQKYTVDQARLTLLVRKALIKGLESNIIVRPVNSATSNGVTGRFRLAARKPTKDPKVAKKRNESKENTNPNVGEGKEAKAKPGDAKKKAAKKSATEGDKPKAKKDATASKVAPAKKPKSKRSAETDKPEANLKTGKESRSDGEDSGKSSNKRGKKTAQKEEGTNDGAGAIAPKKSKKDSQKAEGGDKAVEATAMKKGKKAALADDGAQTGTAAPKATGKKGKKVAEK